MLYIALLCCLHLYAIQCVICDIYRLDVTTGCSQMLCPDLGASGGPALPTRLVGCWAFRGDFSVDRDRMGQRIDVACHDVSFVDFF